MIAGVCSKSFMVNSALNYQSQSLLERLCTTQLLTKFRMFVREDYTKNFKSP